MCSLFMTKVLEKDLVLFCKMHRVTKKEVKIPHNKRNKRTFRELETLPECCSLVFNEVDIFRESNELP